MTLPLSARLDAQPVPSDAPKASSSPVLPAEIVIYIISLFIESQGSSVADHLSDDPYGAPSSNRPRSNRRTLLNALLVNRLWCNEIEMHLYHSVRLGSNDRHRRSGMNIALMRKPERGTYVRELVVEIDEKSGEEHHGSGYVVLNPLPIPLSRFTALRSLSIRLSSVNASYSDPLISYRHSSQANSPSRTLLVALSKTHFPLLQHLHTSSYSLTNPHFQSFLRAHPSLRSVSLSKTFSTFTLPTRADETLFETLLPKLEVIEGHWSHVIRLIKGRKGGIRHVGLTSANSGGWVPRRRLEEVLPIIAAASKESDGTGIKSFSVSVAEVTPRVVRAVAAHLPGLEVLELTDGSAEGMPWDDNEERWVELGEALGSFMHLMRLSLTFNTDSAELGSVWWDAVEKRVRFLAAARRVVITRGSEDRRTWICNEDRALVRQ